MIRCVVDSSVVLAFILNEPIQADPMELLCDCAMSTVNLAEVHAKLASRGVANSRQTQVILSSIAETIPFSVDAARYSGELVLKTAHAGLSLGDRACLALASSLGVPAYTTDRAWLRVDVGVPVHLIR